MAYKFGHKYELFIGHQEYLVQRHNAPTGFEGTLCYGNKTPKNTDISIITGGYIDYITIPQEAIKITNPIQLEADIVYKTGKTSGAPQGAKIKLYNIAESTINYIVAEASILLKAGYEQDTELPIVFVGQVLNASTQRVGQDMITTITAKDGANTLKNTLFAANYPEGQTYSFVINQLLKTFNDNGIPTGDFQNNSDRAKQAIKDSATYSGKLSEVMTEVCGDIDYTWYISKGKIYVQPEEEDRLIDLVSIDESQVIGSISSNDDKTGISSSDKKGKPAGVKVTTFLVGDLSSHVYIKILYGDYQGYYKPDSITHKLNWKKGPWTTTISSQKVETYDNNNTI